MTFRKLNKKITKLNKEITKLFDVSYDTVLEAFYQETVFGSDKAFLASNCNCSIAKIDPDTNFPVDVLMYFPDYFAIQSTKKYLEAYLLTNEDVLDEDEIVELKSLIDRYK